jgi:hypothetical protein
MRLILNFARSLLSISHLLPPPCRSGIAKLVQKLELLFVARRAAKWKLDAPGRLQWIDDMGAMIQKAKSSYNENIRLP